MGQTHQNGFECKNKNKKINIYNRKYTSMTVYIKTLCSPWYSHGKASGSSPRGYPPTPHYTSASCVLIPRGPHPTGSEGRILVGSTLCLLFLTPGAAGQDAGGVQRAGGGAPACSHVRDTIQMLFSPCGLKLPCRLGWQFCSFSSDVVSSGPSSVLSCSVAAIGSRRVW